MTITEFDKNMGAVAFAEAGEHETAREMLGKGGAKTQPGKAPVPHKKKPYGSALLFGAISISAYVVLFKNEALITDVFTMGGWRTLFPVLTAFLFSFVHGAFASNLLSCLGLEAKK
jgi:hypothetical protein